MAVSYVFDLNRISSLFDDFPIVELHELKVGYQTSPTLVNTTYDGEFQMYLPSEHIGGPDRVALVGDLVPAEPPVDDFIGCWSFYVARGINIDLIQTTSIRQYAPCIAFTSY